MSNVRFGNSNGRQRKLPGLSPRVRSRRSSILKRTDTTPTEKENTGNLSRRKSSVGGLKRRVSFSQTIDVRVFDKNEKKAKKRGNRRLSDAQYGDKKVRMVASKKVGVSNAIPSLDELLDEEAIPQFGETATTRKPFAAIPNPAARSNSGGMTGEWGLNYTRSSIAPRQSIDSILDVDDLNASVIPSSNGNRMRLTANFAENSIDTGDMDDSRVIGEATLDAWGAQQRTVNLAKEMEVTNNLGGLDTKTYDFADQSATTGDVRNGPVETVNFAEGAKTVNVTANMSMDMDEDDEVEEEAEDVMEISKILPKSSAPKTINFATDMSLVAEEDSLESESEKSEQEIAATQKGNENDVGAKTMNFATDMEMTGQVQNTGTVNFGAKTVNVATAMEIEDSSEEDEADMVEETNKNVASVGAKTMNFATDMEMTGAVEQTQTMNIGAKTINVATAMEMSSEEEEEEEAAAEPVEQTVNFADGAKTVNMAVGMEIEEEDEDEDESGEEVSMSWGIKNFEENAAHLKAANAIRKSLEMGEHRLSLGRKSLDRARPAPGTPPISNEFRRPSLDIRESLNRSSLLLSPVEETAEMEEDEAMPDIVENEVKRALNPSFPPASANRKPKASGLKQPSQSNKRPLSQLQQPATTNTVNGARTLVNHPIAGIQIAAPPSRLPGLFDKRYSRKTSRKSSASDAPTSIAADAPVAPPPTAIQLPKFTPVMTNTTATIPESNSVNERQSVDEDSMSISDRRMSDVAAASRQSISPSDLSLNDFMFLANVKFADNIETIKAARANLELCAHNDEDEKVKQETPLEVLRNAMGRVEQDAVHKECLRMLKEIESLEDDIANLENSHSLTGGQNPLFAAVQTSDQMMLEALQQDLSQLREGCIQKSQSITNRESAEFNTNIGHNYRALGESAVENLKDVDVHVKQMRKVREGIQNERNSEMESIMVLRAKKKGKSRSHVGATRMIKRSLKAMEKSTTFKIESDIGNSFKVGICNAIELSIESNKDGTFNIVTRLSKSLPPLSKAVIEGIEGIPHADADAADLSVFQNIPGDALGKVVGDISRKILRVEAAIKELKSLSRTYNVVYTKDGADVYFSFRDYVAIINIPVALLSCYPEPSKQLPTMRVIRGDSSKKKSEQLVIALEETTRGGLCSIQKMCTRFSKALGKNQ